ncbi:MAG: hypothetical protein KatS3mg111_2540 [Pirellulaceae bacterium]|nr:MAG: hypothetical protein KatS3mg111_2540 [Pirellulaceae bacterium]
MKRHAAFAPLLWIVSGTWLGMMVVAQETASQATSPRAPQEDATVDGVDRTSVNDGQEPQSALHQRFERLLTGARLTGHFTVDGMPLDRLREESYEILQVEKLPEGDLWQITARIVYGDRDLTLPVPIEVKWAGTTPVLTLDNWLMPGLGTFSARVVLHRDKYAGTWQHDDRGGHLFGKIQLAANKSTAESSAGKSE